MRVKQQTKTHRKRPYEWWIAIAAILAFVLLSFYQWSQRQQVKQSYFCDMENRSLDQRKFLSNGQKFTGGNTQSSDKAFRGSYSAKCDATQQFGPGVKLDGLYEGDVIEASVWRQSDDGYGVIAFQGNGNWSFYDYASEVVKSQKGWDKIKNTVRVPIGVRNGTMSVYAYNSKKKGAVYFDDFALKYWPSDTFSLAPPVEYAGSNLQLKVDKKEMKQLRAKRVEAFAYGNLLSGKEDLVGAKLLDDSTELDVEIRLKGDLLDHLESKKWSFRIIPDKGKSWKGMTEFSVHNSLSRSHLNEWVYHQMLSQEGILTTRYDFVKLLLNEDPLGIYAYEEHFGSSLIRHQKRPEGPILRFNEDGLWQYASRGIGERPDWFESADISVYDSKRILNNQTAYEQYTRAQDLLYSFIKGEKPPAEVFDTDRMAKYLAIQDVCIAHHSFIFTNVRFYFNPLTGLLEPIGYDGYTDDMTRNYRLPTIAGAALNSRMPKYYASHTENAHFHALLFNDYSFAEKYIGYLDQFTSVDYQQSFLRKHMSEIQAREKFIQRDYPKYKFDPDFYFRNANMIRKILPPLDHISLKAYKSNNGVTLESYHNLPLEILGAGDKEISIPAPDDLILESFNDKRPVRRYTFSFAGKAKNIFYKTLGTDSIATQPIARWEIPKVPATPIVKSTFQQFDFIRSEKNGSIYFKPGIHTIRQTLAIPEGHQVIIPPGMTLQMENGAAFSSRSPIQAIGTVERPIVFTSLTGGGQGLFLVNSKDENSNFQYCTFHNLKAFQQGGQFTEGSVSLYNSKATFEHCTFSKSLAKNAIHLVESDYRINDATIKETNGDGVDADYSVGAIKRLRCEQIGKDAIEVSGGLATLYGVTIESALGSGIQATLQARVNGGTVVIKDTKKGISANDLSKIVLQKVNLTKVVQGFVAYQQLADYGGGRINVGDYVAKEVTELFVREVGSEIRLKGKLVD